MDATLKRTPLHAAHAALGAKLVPFAGWEMPVQYEGVRPEHRAVRTGAGAFDVSHMGQVEAVGPDAQAFLQRATSNDVSKIPPHGAQYGLLLAEDGGVLDDLFTYRLADDRYLTVTNAANHEADLAVLRERAEGFDVELHDRLHDFAMVAVQGPNARALVAPLVEGGELPGRMSSAWLRVAGVPRVLVAGTGYTGEDGVELLIPSAGAAAVWRAVLDAGVQPIGLAARDTLRLEACFHLHGNDFGPDRNPIEAGVGWAAKEDTGFVGAEAVRAVREAGPAEKLVPFAFTGTGIPRGGNPIVGGGVVTSGTFSPMLDLGVGLAYVPAEKAVPGTSIEVDVRGKVRPAQVRSKPLYPPKEP